MGLEGSEDFGEARTLKSDVRGQQHPVGRPQRVGADVAFWG